MKRPGQQLRLLELPRDKEEWARRILTDYLNDEGRAADLHEDFAALTNRGFTEHWELGGREIENALIEVEFLRARWRVALMRG